MTSETDCCTEKPSRDWDSLSFSCTYIFKLYLPKRTSELLCFGKGEWGGFPLNSLLTHPFGIIFYSLGRVSYFHWFHCPSAWRRQFLFSAHMENIPGWFAAWLPSASAIPLCKMKLIFNGLRVRASGENKQQDLESSFCHFIPYRMHNQSLK